MCLGAQVFRPHYHQLSPECQFLVCGFNKFPRTEESPWDPAFPGTVLTWDTLLERANRSRQEGPTVGKETRVGGHSPSSGISRTSMWEKLQWLVRSEVDGARS